ncbi:hypothetical protein DL766_004618 [Monosporascus sp. MC13-8B]|uniref:Uncharacterized protein n=1 Tax=Monosporascus cannonballus TaxID=155416 RepID=A0ABY0HA09_9PEZI|nr:hypothetical protein DL762_004074 [Monosporascus cannonballus]RYO90219.1 hypothetical protein DL763_005392 [Monosporascus cannonballus]RYP30967.1 hypothetical protein DL766_004618 [Monosporascus sp. MC13-8B]
MELPEVTDEPKHYPDCCLSISRGLLDVLTDTFRTVAGTGLVLSIGSGSGLLEALLQSRWTAAATSSTAAFPRIEGVEVQASVNRYLPAAAVGTVKGTWEVSPHVRSDPAVAALLFAYPRSPALVSRYLRETEASAALWLGHRSDWPDFEPCFAGAPGFGGAVEVVGGRAAGLVEYEMMAVLRRRVSSENGEG